MIGLLGFVLIPPFFGATEASGMILPLLMSAVLLASLNVFRQSRAEFAVALAFALPALIGRWLLQLVHADELLLMVAACWIAFLGFTVFIILRHILTARRVTYDTISGAICGYLLFGVMYAFGFLLIDYFYPGSFGTALKVSVHPVHIKVEFERFVYFSFVTLASLGYGDIVPLSAPARAFAAIEGIAGQFYIAVLIARLVSLHSSQWGSK